MGHIHNLPTIANPTPSECPGLFRIQTALSMHAIQQSPAARLLRHEHYLEATEGPEQKDFGERPEPSSVPELEDQGASGRVMPHLSLTVLMGPGSAFACSDPLESQLSERQSSAPRSRRLDLQDDKSR